MRRGLIGAAVIGCLTLTGCGGGGSASPAGNGAKTSDGGIGHGASAKTAEAAQQVVEEYYKRFFAADFAGGCALMTPKYQTSQIKDVNNDSDKKVDNCPDSGRVALAFARSFGFDSNTVTGYKDAKVAGDTAIVIATSKAPFDDTLFTLVWDGSTWLLDSDETASATKADTTRWLENWCSVKVGTTVDDAKALMGEPTGDLTEADGGGQVEWSTEGHYSFTAFLKGGKIYQLDTNDSELTAADRAALTCESTRS